MIKCIYFYYLREFTPGCSVSFVHVQGITKCITINNVIGQTLQNEIHSMY